MQTRIIQRGRGGGKTYDIMTEAHAFLIARESVLIVLPNIRAVEYWFAEWNKRFPYATRPEYITIDNRLRIRGRNYHHVYVENVSDYEYGIWDERLFDVRISARTMTFTSSPNTLPPFRDYTPPPATPEAIKRRFFDGLRRKRKD